MKKQEEAAVGGLLHDIGKVIYRAGLEEGDHSSAGYAWLAGITDKGGNTEILNCVRYHHAAKLKGSGIAVDSPAFAVYIADNIAAGADRRERAETEEGHGEGQPFQKTMPLSSVFNIMWGNNCGLSYAASNLGRLANYPSNPAPLTQEIYTAKAAELKGELEKLFRPELTAGYIDSLLTLLENTLSFVPSSTSTNEVADISLYDHSKMTAAVAAAICVYLEAGERWDLRAELLTNERKFMDEKAFLMFSCDFSGIQKFIYTVASKNALKSLRSRSFFLDILMEYLMDELLSSCGMSRANLIYTGGGHSYALLPDTEETRLRLTEFENSVNAWLAAQFQTSLYLACAWRPCSGNDLRNEPAEASPYVQIYRDLSRAVSEKKLRRYSPDELRSLNSSINRGDGRECKICGVTDKLLEKEDICPWCDRFAKISPLLLANDKYAVVTDTPPEKTPCFPVPNIGGGDRYIRFADHDSVVRLHDSGGALRVYSKNAPHTGLNYATNLYMGDYASDKYMEDLAEDANGIKRIAILRADVDNLGLAFTSGFERKGEGLPPSKRDIYKTLSRSAALSRQMSLFFKYHINSILEKADRSAPYFKIAGAEEDTSRKGRKAVVVYSGGDDIFLVGAWNDVIETAVDIRDSLERFTAGTLTISAGITVCRYKYPIYKAGSEAAALETVSKRLDGKDGITLFADEGHTYKWKIFTDSVAPKCAMLAGFLGGEDAERGKAFLYRILELLRGADDKINIARCAYMLARLEPRKDGERKRLFREFSKKIYEWITDRNQRQELITAIQIYIYMTRERADK